MHIKEAIEHRRLIKPDDFNGAQIEDSIIKELLEAANWAPTHALTEPWRFIVYKQNQIKDFCAAHAMLYKNNTDASSFSESTYQKILHRGDLASHLLVCYMKRGHNQKISQLEEISATACSIQNLWLMAAHYNLGLYWGTGGMVLKPAMHQYFKLQPEDVMMGLLFIGGTDIEWPKGRRNSSIDEKTIWK